MTNRRIATTAAAAVLGLAAFAAPAGAEQPHTCADGAEPDGAVTGVTHEVVHDTGVLAPVPPADEAFGDAECAVHDETGL